MYHPALAFVRLCFSRYRLCHSIIYIIDIYIIINDILNCFIY